jgi:hypothetical protein
VFLVIFLSFLLPHARVFFIAFASCMPAAYFRRFPSTQPISAYHHIADQHIIMFSLRQARGDPVARHSAAASQAHAGHIAVRDTASPSHDSLPNVSFRLFLYVVFV